ncbi:MAG: cytochrome c biogenesis protein CcmE [Kordiimonadales bacterium]|nr:MAG: cytochrome c biogenesis protein CcmE [Kordiimonadales bacterium]
MAGGLRTRKKQRLWIVSTALTAVIGAVLLILFALGGDGFNLFLQPTAVKEKQIVAGQRFRLGGLVKAASFRRLEDGLTYEFLVTDCVTDINVHFRGILPDLFREGQGVITEGRLDDTGLFVADTVLAKHDENYAPPGTAPKDAGLCEHPEEGGFGAYTKEKNLVAKEEEALL